MSGTLPLPVGRAGRLLALGITLVLAMAAWFAVAAPLLDWHAERAARLEQRQALARRMASVAASLPQLQRAAASGSPAAPAATALLDGATDAVAAATLQERVQDMAGRSGAAISSIETLPPTQAGGYRRIGLRVALSAPWPVLVGLLQAIETASPRMLVDDLQLHGPRMVAPPPNPPLDASLTVIAFRAGAAGAPR